MGNRLNTRVFVDGSWHGPGDVPDEIADLIDNPKVWEDQEPLQVPVPVSTPAADLDTAETLERPRGNASRDKWADYARSRGIDVEDDMNRDDIVAAIQLADEE